MSILSSMEFVWFKAVLADELLGPPSRLWTPTCEEVSGEKNPPMGSIPKASRWPVSLIVRPVFLDSHNLLVSHRPEFFSIYLARKNSKGNKGKQRTKYAGGQGKTHRPATPISARKLCSRALGGGPIINDERLLEPVVFLLVLLLTWVSRWGGGGAAVGDRRWTCCCSVLEGECAGATETGGAVG